MREIKTLIAKMFVNNVESNATAFQFSWASDKQLLLGWGGEVAVYDSS